MDSYTSRKNYETFAKTCVYGNKASCVCACPFNFDVPSFIKYMQEGNYKLAYKQYQSQSIFPGIVSKICNEPCKKACVRCDLDESISMRLLEKASIDYSNVSDPPKFNLPRKNKKIAVIGAGLCGLTCATKLGSKNYDVTIYEKSDRIGGRLWQLLDPDEFLSEIAFQMKNAHCEYIMETTINTLDDIEYDAAFISTGKGENDFGLREGLNKNSFSTVKNGVFMGGNILSTLPVEDIAHGVTAAHSIEKYLKTGLMDGIPETFILKQSQIRMDLSRVPPAAIVRPKSAEKYEKEEALCEASRCLKCNCTICSDGCEVFSFFNKPPKLMVGDAMASLHTKASFTGQQATRTMSSCNLCGLCGTICPEKIDMGKFFYDFRQFKSEDKMYPPAFHDFFIRDMHFSNKEAYLVHTAPRYNNASHLFFPGCQLAASDPRYVEKTYNYLLERIPDTALMLSCCGAPADWAAEKKLNRIVIDKFIAEWEKMNKPIIIYACPTCKHQFERHAGHVKGTSLYDMIVKMGLPDETKRPMNNACVFDPCSSRYDPSMQQSVRKIAERAKVKLKELHYSKEKAQCCGFGGHIVAANPTLYNIIVDNRISADDEPYITYCTNCHDTFSIKGKTCYHILDVAFNLNQADYVPPSLSQRRKNRLIAKNNILKKVFNIHMEETKDYKEDMTVIISEDLIKKMNDGLILYEDVYSTIAHCEETGNKLKDTQSGFYIGHLRIGLITYWVEYFIEDDKYILKNVYSHRVQIVEQSHNYIQNRDGGNNE